MRHSEKENKLINEASKIKAELVYEKKKLIKAYRYYHGKRDPNQYKHLEENYGLGNASSVEFVPLVRKHIDVLVGEYLTIPVQPKISCKDEATLSNIFREKQLKIHSETTKKLEAQLKAILKGSGAKEDSQLIREIKELQESLDRNFISDYEIAAQNIVEWIMQSDRIDFTQKRKHLLIDLLITGTCYFRVLESPSGDNIDFEVLNPLHTFIDRNYGSEYHKNASRAVVRQFLTKDEIIIKFGEYLDQEDIDSLDLSDTTDVSYHVRSYADSIGRIDDEGILGNYEVTPHSLNYDYQNYYNRYTVYDMEWLKTEKEKGEWVMNRYRAVSIGENIWIPIGKIENAPRTMSDPKRTTLSIGGMFYSDRNGEPISLVLETASLQDKFDVLCFYRDNLIAQSGTKGTWVDVAFIPTVFGSDVTERLMKFQAYMKQGLGVIDSSLDGEPMNTMFGGYDNTLAADAVQAIELALDRVENTCSTITGVFKEKLGGIEQRDAVTNVQVGIRQSTYITKQYFHTMDLVTREVLIDSLNTTKTTFKKGISGTIILGERLNRVFTALPKHYTLTDFDIHIQDTTEAMKEAELMRQFGMQLATNNNADPTVLLEIITSKSLTKMKEDVLRAISKTKEENGMLNQLQQQNEQLQQTVQQLERETQTLQRKIQSMNEDKLRLEKDKLEFEKELRWYEAREQTRFNNKKLENEEKHIEAEILELYDDNPRNNEIKNIR